MIEGPHLDLELVVFRSRLGNLGHGGSPNEENPGKHEDEQVFTHGFLPDVVFAVNQFTGNGVGGQ